MNWQEISGSWVLLPSQAEGVIHFLGGAFVANAPQLTYRWLLEQLARSGYAVIATPFVNTFDHQAIARSVLNRFEITVQRLPSLRDRYLPVYGIGHSMGGKIHLLVGSLYGVERSGNIFIAYNNFPAKRAIPFFDRFELPKEWEFEFTPSPEATHAIAAQDYGIRRNLLIKFTNDTIDQTEELAPILQGRFPNLVTTRLLPGNHGTPLSQDIDWKAGNEFTPLDAVVQWAKQEFSRDLNRLKQEILRWLDPTKSLTE